MLKLNLTFLALISANAVAATTIQPSNIRQSLFNLFNAHSSVAAEPQPIRQARIKILIQKITPKTNSNGELYFEDSTICTNEVNINVYDARGGKPSFGTRDLAFSTCPTTYHGEDISVAISGAVALFDGGQLGRSADFKGAFPQLSFSSKKNSALPKPLSTFIGSGGLDNHDAMIGLIRPTELLECADINDPKSCKPNDSEYFHAILEIVD